MHVGLDKPGLLRLNCCLEPRKLTDITQADLCRSGRLGRYNTQLRRCLLRRCLLRLVALSG